MLKIKIAAAIAVALLTAAAWLFWPHVAAKTGPIPAPAAELVETAKAEEPTPPPTPPLSENIKAYLQSKKSPMVAEAEFLTQQTHWKLIIAISNAESTYCRFKIDWNCWGLGGESRYRHYKTLHDAIADMEKYLENWKYSKLTPEAMVCTYVGNCSKSWLRNVNTSLHELQNY